MEKKMSYLLRNAVVKYTDMEINADYVEINWETAMCLQTVREIRSER